MHSTNGLTHYRSRLHPEVIGQIDEWGDDEELSKLLATLRATTNWRAFLDAWAEAMVARHLLERDCRLHVEVPTPSGRTCDFHVQSGEESFYLHVKHIDTSEEFQRKLTVSSRLRYLERIARPYVVSVRWENGLSDRQMQQFVTNAAEFITHARLGDELVVRDDETGERIAGCHIVAPWEGSHVSVVIGLPPGFMELSTRMEKMLQKAYRQFMPRAVNVILIGSSNADDGDDCETALLGSHVERWDQHPKPGRRIAHGRAGDGFWHTRRYDQSAAAGWFRLQPEAEALHGRLWFRQRDSLPAATQETLKRLFFEEA